MLDQDGNQITERLPERASWGGNGDIQLQEPCVLPILAETARATAAFRSLEATSFLKRSGPGPADSLDLELSDGQAEMILIPSIEALGTACQADMLQARAAPSLPRPVSCLQAICLDETEQRLYEYFVTKYCKGRTLYSDERYNSFLQAIPPSPPREFMAAIFCLTSLYIGGPEMNYFHEVITFLNKTVRSGMSDSEVGLVVSIIRLLVQYHSIKRDLDRSWVFHIKGFSAIQSKILMHAEAQSLSIPITYESILKFVPILQDGDLPNDGISIDYLLTLENPREIRDFGCSPELLHLLGRINEEDHHASRDPLRRVQAARLLLARYETIVQTTPERHKIRRQGIERSAESYAHMARVIIYWRLLGYGSCSTVLRDAGNALAKCVLCVPTREWFTSQYPLAPAFWAMIFSPECGQKCYDILASVWTDRPTNITHALRVVDLVRKRSQTSGVDINVFTSVMTSLQMEELSLG